MLVPLISSVPESESTPADTTPLPGAQMSVQEPKFENEERASPAVVEPTVMALGM